MFQILQTLVRAIQPLLVPLCLMFAWAIVILIGWSILSAMRDTVARSRRMHQIPCANCQFFTKDYHLKCTVHPSLALTEEAIDCPDFNPITTLYQISQESVHR
ncbi:MAG: hypothetical protein WCA35_26915 [Kovacikia sp.]